jgi:hypothetical protein
MKWTAQDAKFRTISKFLVLMLKQAVTTMLSVVTFSGLFHFDLD